jgi:hypothetical protein
MDVLRRFPILQKVFFQKDTASVLEKGWRERHLLKRQSPRPDFTVPQGLLLLGVCTQNYRRIGGVLDDSSQAAFAFAFVLVQSSK